MTEAFAYTPENESRLGITRVPMGHVLREFAVDNGSGAFTPYVMGQDWEAGGRIVGAVLDADGYLIEFFCSDNWDELVSTLATSGTRAALLDDSAIMPLTFDERHLQGVLIRERELYLDCFGVPGSDH